MSLQQEVLDRARAWSYGHPRAKMLLREGWGVSRELAHGMRLPAPFEPAEFDDLRRLRDTAPQLPAQLAGRLLVLSTRGWSTHNVIEATIAHAARWRGWETVFATCGGRLPVCDVAPIHAAPPMPCHSCGCYANDALRAAGYDAVNVDDLIDIRRATRSAKAAIDGLHTVAECESYAVDGFPLGAFVRTSVAWFLSRGTLLADDETLRTYRSFLVSGSVLRIAFTRLLDRTAPDRILVLNGVFFPERILAELADARTIPVTRYEKGFLTDSVLVSRWRRGADDLDPGDAAWNDELANPLGPVESAEIDEYLNLRERGALTLDNFWKQRVEDTERIRAELRLDTSRRLVVAFLNILWDSAIQDKDTAFASMGGWLVELIQWAAARPHLDLVVRLHPAEVKLANHVSRERMSDHIDARFPRIPDNVRVVHSESDISSYTLMTLASVGLVYTSTVGLEMAARSMPVICAAKTHYGGRGFTADPGTAGEYWALLDGIVASPPDEAERARVRDLARRYAHLFFFRYHQDLDVVHEVGRSRPRVAVESAAQLAPGRHAALDRVLDAVVGDTDAPVVTPRRVH